MNRKEFFVISTIVIISFFGIYFEYNKSPQPHIKMIDGSGKLVTLISRVSPDDIYPNPTVTPGSINSDITQDNILQTICSSNWHGINPYTHVDTKGTGQERPLSSYTTALKKFQLGIVGDFSSLSYKNGLKLTTAGAYKTTDTNTADYEEDHLISLELGGNPTDSANLWPEPYNTSVLDGGAKVKDTVENYLHKQVCNGSMTLAEAQKEVSTDWYAVYKLMKPTFGNTNTTDNDDE